MRTTAMCVVGVLFGCSSAWAQPSPPPADSAVTVVVGSGRTWDDEGQIGSGPIIGGRFERRLRGNTFAEAGFDWLRHERTGHFAAQGRTLLFSATLLQRFGHARARPYLLGGVVAASHEGTSGFPEQNLISTTSSTDLGVAFGGGLAIRAGDRFELGPELRFLVLTADDDRSPAWIQWLGVKFVVRF